VGATTQRLAARLAAAGLAAAAALSLGAAARADDPSTVRALRAENSQLEATSHRVLLELYALESRLATAEQRVAALSYRAEEAREKEEAARRQLALARATHAEAERRLEARLRALYIAGEPDPLAVLLGADSLDDVISTFEGLDRTARQERQIVAQLVRARRTLRTAVARLSARTAELRRSVESARAARASLAAARAERVGYLADILRRRELNRSQIATLSAQAAESEQAAIEIATGSGGGGGAPVAAPVSAPLQGGRTLTVSSTGYCLQGTTATGIPVGWGVVAVDPSVIPLGTRMTIPGYGEGTAADTGGAVVGAIIDLWFPTCSQAIAWGRRTVTITLH
jgi:3D (Asp-Asp-Asp) domain-containing protein/peptidoglycan hydrolase CwlO-like protein